MTIVKGIICRYPCVLINRHPKSESKSAPTTMTSKKPPVFPVGKAGKNELKRILVRSTDPEQTITSYQQSHSLHSMLAKAFGTTPRYAAAGSKDSAGKKASDKNGKEQEDLVEPMDTDSVLKFLSHLGVSQHEIHKKISDALLKELEDEIRKTSSASSASNEPLLHLLKSSWNYATAIPELRPVLWAVLKQLGDQTPVPVLNALAERDPKSPTGELKYPEVFHPLPPHLKRLVWEADWDNKLSQHASSEDLEPNKYLDLAHETLFGKLIQPLVEDYCNNAELVDAANRPFVASVRERRMLTTQRRAVTVAAAAAASSKPTTAIMTTNLATVQAAPTAAPAAGGATTNSSGRVVARIRQLLVDTSGGFTVIRPKLLQALISIMMARHACASGTSNKRKSHVWMGPDNLHCTLLADIFLASGGPLPKAYQHVLALARVLDDCVKNGLIQNADLAKLQEHLRLIFEIDENATVATTAVVEKVPGGNVADEAATAATGTTFIKRQLNRIITQGITSMKEADPRSLFLNPVTDDIAPGYSKVIDKPMCIRNMEEKVAKNAYGVLSDWEHDVKLMFDNCVRYNRGTAGQWFRGEARRQHKVFKDEILAPAKKQYQAELTKRKGEESKANENDGDASNKKRALGSENAPKVLPLPASAVKKHKKDVQDQLPSMPALACMLLSDPFVLRLLLDRFLRALRMDVMQGGSIPAAHCIIPSLLQLSHMAQWSPIICAHRGKKYFVPDAGFIEALSSAGDDVVATLPFDSLRRYIPLIVRLLLEAELDRRMSAGGDLQAVASPRNITFVSEDDWAHCPPSQVLLALLEGALVLTCQPGNSSESSLSLTYPKFALALQSTSSSSLLNERPFFLCLIQALLRHKSKLSRATRDLVVSHWLVWLRTGGKDTIWSPGHECLIQLLNEWAALGNLLLPRDMLVKFCTETVDAVDATASRDENMFAAQWNLHVEEQSENNSRSGDFCRIQKQYERIIQSLPKAHAEQWRQNVGLLSEATQTTANEEPVNDTAMKENDVAST